GHAGVVGAREQREQKDARDQAIAAPRETRHDGVLLHCCPATFMGSNRFRRLPSPIWPSSPIPQQYAMPLTVRPHPCQSTTTWSKLRPPAMATGRLEPSFRPGPAPNVPRKLSPQQYPPFVVVTPQAMKLPARIDFHFNPPVTRTGVFE